MGTVVNRRRVYKSRLRTEQARVTRSRILSAAETLFAGKGYAATTIAEVAHKAGVSSETVFSIFGNKRSLLAELIEVAIAGEEQQTPILERKWVAAMQNEPDPAKRLRYLISHTTETLERTGALHEIIRDAKADDPHLIKLKESRQQYRFEAQRTLMKLVAESNEWPFRQTEDEATETVWVLTSPELHNLLRVDRGWSKERYQAWLTNAVEVLLLTDMNRG